MSTQEKSTSVSIKDERSSALRVHGIRLLHLTDRDSSVMTVSQVDEYSRHDPLINTFRIVTQLHNIPVSGEVAVMPETRFSEALISKSSIMSSDLLLVPWSETGSIGDSQVVSSTNTQDKFTSSYTSFVESILQAHECNIAVLLTNDENKAPLDTQNLERRKLTRVPSFNSVAHEFPILPISNKSHHIVFPYFGGKDDKFALTLVLQLCEKTNVTATIVQVCAPTKDATTARSKPDDYFGFISTHVRSELASRIKFDTTFAGSTVEQVLERVASELGTHLEDTSRHNLIVLGRDAAADVKSTKMTASQSANEEVKACLGVMTSHLVERKVQADMVVVQARMPTIN